MLLGNVDNAKCPCSLDEVGVEMENEGSDVSHVNAVETRLHSRQTGAGELRVKEINIDLKLNTRE